MKLTRLICKKSILIGLAILLAWVAVVWGSWQTVYQRLLAPEGDDILLAVDISDASMSQDGTNKWIRLRDLPVSDPVQAALGGKEDTQLPASQADAEEGTEAQIRKFSPERLAQAIAALAIRDVLLGQIAKGAGNTLDLPGGAIIIGGRGYPLQAASGWDPLDAENDDGAVLSLSLGDDIYIYALSTPSGKWIASRNAVAPIGYTTANSRKVGGFHYGRIRATNSAGTPVDGAGSPYGSGWESNVSTGIVPNSVWDLNNRPTCSPEGMAKVGRIWVDIYETSAGIAPSLVNGKLAAGTAKSAYNATPLSGTEGLNWYHFNELARRSGKRLLTYQEWLQAAEGSPQGNDGDNVNAWSATTNGARTTTGAVARAVSAANIVDCVGNLYEWLADLVVRWDDTGAAGQGWVWADPMGGQGVGRLHMYDEEALVAVRAGASWNNGVRAGSRSVVLANYPWFVHAGGGCRLACGSL